MEVNNNDFFETKGVDFCIVRSQKEIGCRYICHMTLLGQHDDVVQ